MPCSLIFVLLEVNDVVIHPNQGELISCDQAGSIKQWDLSENVCMLDLVSFPSYFPAVSQKYVLEGTSRRRPHSVNIYSFRWLLPRSREQQGERYVLSPFATLTLRYP